jgi:hypothetical protein
MSREIEIPNEFMGVPVNEDTLKDTLSSKRPQPEREQDTSSSNIPGELPDKVKENPKDYIVVPEKRIVIATRQHYNNLNWENSIRTVAEDNLCLTPIDSFMQHFLNLRDAAQGKKQLVYADGSLVSRDDAINHWNYVSSTDRSPFGNKPFWTWLDAKFKETPQGLQIRTNHRVKSSNLESTMKKIDPHMSESGWADLDLNSQGLPKNSAGSNYMQGQNMYFWSPVKDKVARFVAGSGGADLCCDGGCRSRGSSLGVFACAAGVAPQNSGGKS